MPFINPFDTTPGFGLAEMTQSINILPNQYGRVNQIGLFAPEGISQTTAVVDIKEGVMNLLPSVPRGGPATVGNRDIRSMRAFVVPHIPHNDVITPDDLQGIRQFGTMDQTVSLASLMAERQQRMRDKHGQTLEFMRINALKGVLKDGSGSTVYNWFTEFGVQEKSVDFLLGTAGTNVGEKCREVVRWIKKNLNGETMNGVHALVSPTFWDKFIKHSSVKEAYTYFANLRGGQPLRDDVRSGFEFHGITFEEYDATFTLSDGSTTEDAFDAGDGRAFPLGTRETFKTFFAPANWMETVNTRGLETYARQVTRQDGSGIDLLTQSNPLPIVRRPKLIVKLTTSN